MIRPWSDCLLVAPRLVAEEGTDQAVAVEPVTRARDPFPVTQVPAFSSDARTRVMLFAENAGLLPGETPSALTATAEDAAHNVYPLTVERVDPVPGFEWMSSIDVRLSDQATSPAATPTRTCRRWACACA